MSEPLARLYQETLLKLAPAFGFQLDVGRMVEFDKLPDRDRRLLIGVFDLLEQHFYGGDPDDANTLDSEFYVQSGFGHRTQQPFVSMSFNGRKIAHLAVDEAQALALNLLSAAEASLGDAFLISFLRERVGVEDNVVGGLLLDFRAWRDKGDEEGREG